MKFRFLFVGCLLVCGLAKAQVNNTLQSCVSPHDVVPKGTSYYTMVACPFDYTVPQTRQIQLLRENPQCKRWGPVEVDCASAVTGNYGQVRFGPGAPPPPPPFQFVVPSAPPPLGVPPAQQAAADQLWQQADGLLNRNRKADALQVLLKAANMGHPRAQALLGIMFQDGTGVKADDRAAAYWFKAAAAQGHRGAEYALAGMYFDGDGGLPKDPAKATQLLIQSANQGLGQAQYAIAFQYEVGDGVPRDRQKAIALFRASGDGVWIADVLADPKTPGHFTNEVAFGDYLAGLRNAEFAASWAKARAALPSGGGGGNVMSEIEHGNWVRAGGNDNHNNPFRQ
jgi:hypothetical protein